MKKTPYTITDVLKISDYTERKIRTEANVQALLLGPVQSKRYFESVAVLRQARKKDKATDLALRTLRKYHGV